MRAREAAAYLGLSYWKILELCKKGILPHTKVDGLYLFRRETLDAWLAEQEAASIKNYEDKQDPNKIRRLIS
jgi:excisionase family DNA binding protein